MADDFAFVMQILSEYADDKQPAKSAIAEKARDIVAQVNESRHAAGFPALIKEKSVRTCERWIDTYLDPFTAVMKRDGLAAARREFKTSEQRALATFPG